VDGDTSPHALARPQPRRRLATRVHEWVTWFGAGRLAVTAASVAAIAVGGYLLVRVPQPPVEAGLPRASAAVTTPPASLPDRSPPSVTGTVVVHVAGAVESPGLYHLAASGRVDDAVRAAGGATSQADVGALNLASPLQDGMRVYVPVAGQPVPVVVGPVVVGPPGSGPPAGPLNINTAATDELDSLPGVGPSTAAAIVSYRQAHGPFTSVDDLADVRGIGPAKLDALRPLVTV
jgi:competence protein ComEA